MPRSRRYIKKLAERMDERRKENPKRKVELWAFDEHRVGLKPILRRQWAPKRQRPIALGQHRFEWLYLYGFVHPSSGAVVWFVCTTVDTDLLSVVLAAFARTVGAGRDKLVVLVLDNAGWQPQLIVSDSRPSADPIGEAGPALAVKSPEMASQAESRSAPIGPTYNRTTSPPASCGRAPSSKTSSATCATTAKRAGVRQPSGRITTTCVGTRPIGLPLRSPGPAAPQLRPAAPLARSPRSPRSAITTV